MTTSALNEQETIDKQRLHHIAFHQIALRGSFLPTRNRNKITIDTTGGLVVCSNTNGLSQFFRYRDCNIIGLGIKLSVRRLVSFGIVPCWIFGAFPTDIRFY